MVNKIVIQNHHLIYENKEHKQKEHVVKIFKGEHWAITILQRRKNFSEGCIKALELLILLNKDKAIKLQ